MISTTIAFVVGLLLGIAIDTRASKERDQRIQDLEKELDFIEKMLRSFDEIKERAENFKKQ